MPSYPKGVGLMIGVPHGGKNVVIEWAYSVAQLHPPMNFEVRWQALRNKPVDEARNILAQQAIAWKAKYLFFIDDDVTVPPHALRNLIYHLDHFPEYAVAGGIYCHKSPPQMPMVFRGNGMGPYWDWHLGEVFDVSGIGMGCTLIRVQAFLGDEKHKPLEMPFFKTVDDVERYRDGVNAAEAWTEDLYFCQKLTDAGWSIMADGGILCQHWDTPTGVGYSLPEGSKPTWLPGVEKGKKRIVDLGCGMPEESLSTTEGDVLRVDFRDDVKPDYRCDLGAPLPWPTGTFDIVFSSHTLEHFNRTEVPTVLQEWVRILKDDGEFRLVLPNVKWAAQHIMNDEIDSDVMNVLYGGQTYDLNYHKAGFTPKIIEQLLASMGFKKFIWDFHNYHMLVRAWKNQDAVPTMNVVLAKTPLIGNTGAYSLCYENLKSEEKKDAKTKDSVSSFTSPGNVIDLSGISVQPATTTRNGRNHKRNSVSHSRKKSRNGNDSVRKQLRKRSPSIVGRESKSNKRNQPDATVS